MPEKGGHSMDNGFIVREINNNQNVKERKDPGGRLGSTI